MAQFHIGFRFKAMPCTPEGTNAKVMFFLEFVEVECVFAQKMHLDVRLLAASWIWGVRDCNGSGPPAGFAWRSLASFGILKTK